MPWLDWMTDGWIQFFIYWLLKMFLQTIPISPQIEAIYLQRGQLTGKAARSPGILCSAQLEHCLCSATSAAPLLPVLAIIELAWKAKRARERALPRASKHAWKQTSTRKNEISGSFKRKCMNCILQPRFLKITELNKPSLIELAECSYRHMNHYRIISVTNQKERKQLFALLFQLW